MNSVIPVRITFRTTFFDSFRSRQIVLIPLPSVKCSRLIFAPRRWARTNGAATARSPRSASRARPPIIIEGTMDPTPGRWGPFWTPITPEAGSLLQAVQQWECRVSTSRHCWSSLRLQDWRWSGGSQTVSSRRGSSGLGGTRLPMRRQMSCQPQATHHYLETLRTKLSLQAGSTLMQGATFIAHLGRI